MNLGFTIFKVAFIFSPILVLRIAEITLSDYLFLLAFVMSFFQSRSIHINSKILRQLYFPLILIFAFASMSTIANPDKFQSSITLGKFFILLILMPWTFRKLCVAERQFDTLVNYYLSGMIFFSIHIIFDRYRTFGISAPILSAREFGFAEHVTNAGGICTISVLSCLIFLDRRKRLLRLTLTTISLFALVLTGSLSGYIATLAGLLVYFYRENGSFISKKNLISVSSLLVFLFILNDAFRISERISHATTGRYDTASSRLENWKLVITSSYKDLPTFLFGNGLNPQNNLVVVSTGELLGPHNIILQCLSAGGVVFAIGIFMFLFQILVIAFRNRTSLDFLPLLVSSFMFAMTSPLMYSRYVWLPFLLALHHSILVESKN